jgi:hypothetical protein
MPANYVLLETIELSQSAASVTFDNIPQTGYTDLRIVAGARSNRGAYEDSVNIRVGNGSVDTGANYSYSILYEYSGASLTSLVSTGQTNMVCQSPVTASSATTNAFGNSYFEIPNYTSSTIKSFTCDSTTEHNGAEGLCGLTAGRWSGTSAINIITLTPTTGTAFLAGSTFGLYGIAATDTTPAVAPKATGGNIVANDGTYWYHAFLTSGTFTPQTSITCNVLQIAGGGGGGSRSGGGGGAGGISYLTSQALTATNYSVIVGSGGTGGSRSIAGTNGSNSQFASLTAAVGGGVGGSAVANVGGASGGSGGGAANNGTGSAGTSGQGFAGGSSNNTSYDAGGGGGAGAVGANASLAGLGLGAGAGGAGVNTYSTWATPTSTGVSGYYAGGGGGGSFGSSNHGAGGAGGGGTGANTAPTAGTVNTGGGGGGCGNSANTDTTPVGANGGSGIVIIRYAMV